jgi:hypothetical protein
MVAENTPFLAKLRDQYNISTTFDPCLSTYTPKYMNNPAVIKVRHPVLPAEPPPPGAAGFL